MLCGWRRRCTSTGSHALNIRQSFWPALPSPPKLGPREPPTVDQIWVAHNTVWSASPLHLHREPCSKQQAQFLTCPTLPHPFGPKKLPIVDQNRVSHHAVSSALTLHLHREPCSKQHALFLACPTLPSTVGPLRTTHCGSESGGPSCCAVGVDVATPGGALLRTTGLVFGLPYPLPIS